MPFRVVLPFTTTTLVAAVAPTATAVAPVCLVSEIVTAVARPSSPKSVDASSPPYSRWRK
jgi:hypothetical protein